MHVGRKILLTLAVGILIGGLLSYSLLANAGYLSAKSSTNQGLKVEGHGVIKVFDSQGKLVREWQGYNTLTGFAAQMISGCASGYPGKIFPLNACSDFTNGTTIGWNCNGIGCPSTGYITVTQTASDLVQCYSSSSVCEALGVASDIPFSGTPPTSASCNPTLNNNLHYCDGWNVTSTYSGGFTTQDCATSGCTVISASALIVTLFGGLVSGNTFAFDNLSPSITVTPGDTLILTISFQVS